MQQSVAFVRADLLPERLADWLRDEIATGSLRPGERLVEQVLCKRAGVSRVPLREALRMVASDGLVTLAPHRGATVTPLSRTELEELFGLRIALEGYATGLAARSCSVKQSAGLRTLIEQMRQAVARGDWDAYHALASRFHSGLVQAGGNTLLAETYERLRVRLRRYQAAMAQVPDLPSRSILEHEAILDAVEGGFPEDARSRTEAHLQALIERYSGTLNVAKDVELDDG